MRSSRKVAGTIAAVVVAAVLVGAVVALVSPSDKRGVEGSRESSVSATTAPSPSSVSAATETALGSSEGGNADSARPSPTPVLQTASPIVPSPPPLEGAGPAPSWLFGVYKVTFTLEADECGVSLPSQEHEIVLGPTDSGGVRVEDRTVKMDAMEGIATATGAFRAEVSRPLLPNSPMVLRQVIVGQATQGGQISGKFWVYPGFRDCGVLLSFAGGLQR